MARDNNLDQFYTNPLTAKKLTSIFAEEPICSKKILAFDIEPKSEQENIITANFLKVPLTKYLEKNSPTRK
ncbi:16978_t:CDS:2 [Entrophospora sp. SA101]|nr:16978_t:CDS:2 [Entrophospora sp. SA101]